MMRNPGRELFSGWNCVPQQRPRRTAAANRSPSYSVQAVTERASRGRQT